MKQGLWRRVMNMSCKQEFKQNLWTKNAHKICEQKFWTKLWSTAVNKSYEHELWTIVVNKSGKQKFWTKSCEQELWTGVVNKSCESKSGEDKLWKKMWTRVLKKVMNKICDMIILNVTHLYLLARVVTPSTPLQYCQARSTLICPKWYKATPTLSPCSGAMPSSDPGLSAL